MCLQLHHFTQVPHCALLAISQLIASLTLPLFLMSFFITGSDDFQCVRCQGGEVRACGFIAGSPVEQVAQLLFWVHRYKYTLGNRASNLRLLKAMTYIHRYYQRCHGHGYQHVEISGLLQYQHMHQSSSVRCLFAGKQYHEMSPVPSTFHATPSLSVNNNKKRT